jgi:peptide deformylase
MKLTRKILHRACRLAQFDNIDRNHWLAQEMTEFMIEQGGIGLAANQIGMDLKLFVMQVDGVTRFCFNPEIVTADSRKIEMAEGCLSYIGKQCTIQRPDQIGVRYQDHRGFWIQDSLSGLASRCYQHELDHVNGITMWHRLKEQHAEQS